MSNNHRERTHNATKGSVMRWAGGILGALMALTGGVWMLQGLNILPGSFMTGQMFWFWAGLAAALVGAGVVYLLWRRPAGG